MSNQKNRGEYELAECLLISGNGSSIDLSQMFLEINVYESIFSNSLSGNIIVVDALNYIDLLPITGNERLQLKFWTGGKAGYDSCFENEFAVYNVSERHELGMTSHGYRIDFVAPEALMNERVTINRSLKGTISEMAETVFADYLLDEWFIEVFPTKGIHKFVIPNWSPMYTLNWLTKRALASTDDMTGYMFFQSTESFKFLPVHFMYNCPSDVQFYQNLAPAKTIHSYENLVIEDTKSILEKESKGLLSNRLNVLDLSTRTYTPQDYRYVDRFDSGLSVGAEALPWEQEKSDVVRKSSIIYDQSYRGPNETDMLSANRQHFNSTIGHINNFSYTITIAGDHELRVGYTANIHVPTNSRFSDDSDNANANGGLVLISEIRHTIKPETYFQTIKLTKDGFGNK